VVGGGLVLELVFLYPPSSYFAVYFLSLADRSRAIWTA